MNKENKLSAISSLPKNLKYLWFSQNFLICIALLFNCGKCSIKYQRPVAFNINYHSETKP